MRFTRARDLVTIAIVGGLLAHLAFRLSYAYFPPLPVLAGIPLAVLGVVELVMGFVVRARIQRKPSASRLEPITIARAVVLAKASSILGALMLGVWAGAAVYIAPLSGNVSAARSDLASSLIGMASTAVLLGGALWLEHCCRTPSDPRENP